MTLRWIQAMTRNEHGRRPSGPVVAFDPRVIALRRGAAPRGSRPEKKALLFGQTKSCGKQQ